MSRLLAIVLLAGIYLLTLASDDVLDVAGGVVLAVVVLAVFRRFLLDEEPIPSRALLGRIAAFPRFALVVVREITLGTWQVALIVLGIREVRTPGIIAVPIGERTPTGVATTALAITLSPGELLVDVDNERGVMLIHLLDASDPDAIRERYERFYQRYQKPVLP